MDSRDYAANYGSLSTGDADSLASLSGIGQCRKILEWSSNFNPMQFKYVCFCTVSSGNGQLFFFISYEYYPMSGSYLSKCLWVSVIIFCCECEICRVLTHNI